MVNLSIYDCEAHLFNWTGHKFPWASDWAAVVCPLMMLTLAEISGMCAPPPRLLTSRVWTGLSLWSRVSRGETVCPPRGMAECMSLFNGLGTPKETPVLDTHPAFLPQENLWSDKASSLHPGTRTPRRGGNGACLLGLGLGSLVLGVPL